MNTTFLKIVIKITIIKTTSMEKWVDFCQSTNRVINWFGNKLFSESFILFINILNEKLLLFLFLENFQILMEHWKIK